MRYYWYNDDLNACLFVAEDNTVRGRHLPVWRDVRPTITILLLLLYACQLLDCILRIIFILLCTYYNIILHL